MTLDDTFQITRQMVDNMIALYGLADYYEASGADGEVITAWAGPYTLTVEMSPADGSAWVHLGFSEDDDVMPTPAAAAQQARLAMSRPWLTEFVAQGDEPSIMIGTLTSEETLAAVREALDYMAQHWVCSEPTAPQGRRGNHHGSEDDLG